ncbi:MAG: hypothetical protein JWQ90_3421 [Hydrocarboniphaga sp.]|uniref:Uma2 family endonuclease n=1 Tax=Hydrocarboniphaga sp. TaxID=2033016 RepID=UPI0026188DAC|nr:Uma2 family endonuclease [Hydrocarboniphaga sp.]MDB5970971.1 hypothetical protein [Hydrocarboniphaga sp.]
MFPALAQSDPGSPRPLRFSVDEYLRMADNGVLPEDRRVELLEGEILEMSPTGIPHSARVRRLTRELFAAIADRAVIQIQDPIRIGTHSMPEPDVAVLQGPAERYDERYPEASDVLLVIEVADSSLRYDRERKGRIYAEAGIAEYWLVDVQTARVEQHSQPSSSGYRLIRIVPREADIESLSVPALRISVASFLPSHPVA